jgi:MFS family permease
MLIPELPDHLTRLGGREYIGWIIALFTITAGLARPFSGKITDTVGRVPVMAFGSLVCFVCGLLYPYLLTVSGFLWLRLMHGFSTGTKPTATAAYVADVVPADRRGEAAGMLALFTATGMSFGPAIGGWLAGVISLDALFYGSSVFALLSIGMLLRLPETLPNPKPFRLGLLRLRRDEIFDPEAARPFVVLLLLSFSYGAVLTLAPSFSTAVGISNKGLFFTVYTLASLAVRLVFARSSDRYGRVPVLAVSALVLAVALVWMAVADSLTGFFGSAILFGLASGMNAPTIQAWTTDLSSPATRGRALATMYIALEAGIGLGAVGAGWLLNHTEAGRLTTFGLAGLLSLLASVYLAYLWRTDPIPTT